jgi:hypothetical protein
VLGFEHPEKSDELGVMLDVKIVVDCGDSAHDSVALASEEKLYRCVLVKRVPGGIDQLVYVAAQRRNPVGIVAIESEGELDEFPPVAFRSD